MIPLAWELVPALFGIVASPLAIMALIATLLSERARVNGASFLLGWAVAVTGVILVAFPMTAAVLIADAGEPGPMVGAARLVLGILLAAGAVWTYRRARSNIAVMATASTPVEVAAAAPQLPAWLQAVSSFTAPRSFLLGLGIFALNPINVSCAIAGVLDVHEAQLDANATMVVLSVFCALCILPMAAPLVLLVVSGDRADVALRRLRGWIAKNNGLISALFMAVVAFSQIQKAIQAWV